MHNFFYQDAQNLDEEDDEKEVQVGENEASDVGGGIREEQDDLVIPNFDDEQVQDNEDEMQDDDGYFDHNLDNLLD